MQEVAHTHLVRSHYYTALIASKLGFDCIFGDYLSITY